MMTMEHPAPERPRILFLFSDTGGGHRSAAEAIIEALGLEFGDRVSTRMIDIFQDYAPPPLDHLPAWYPAMVRIPRAWGIGYRLSNGDRRTRLLTASAWPYIRRSIRRMIGQNPGELIVSLHPAANWPVLRALGKYRPPFITVVTDLVSTHALWYHPNVDLCLVPTEQAYQRAIHFGMKPIQLKVVGLPVADRFCQPVGDAKSLRQRFGWPLERPLILLVGGGEGMGPLYKTSRAIVHSCPSASLVIITGRNRNLQARLEAADWPIPTFIYGFVHEMPDFMRAADILVTKAGPGTISEALIAHLPMILYSRLPGQEDGNVTYVVSEGAGVWAPHPDEIISALKDWLSNPAKLTQAEAACQRLARPQAARQTARILVEYLEVKTKVNL